MRAPRGPREMLGLVAGFALAPLVGAGSWLRRGRALHPAGLVFETEVVPAGDVAPHNARLAKNLSGHGLARLSAGLFRRERIWPDLLGLALRFGTDPTGPKPLVGEQDLLLATSRRLWSMPLDALRTNRRDYLRNVYHGMSVFEVERQPDTRLRVVPIDTDTLGVSREQRLRNAVAQGTARFRLEVATADAPHRWEPLVEVRLIRELDVDQNALRFSPFQTGAGLRPQGFIHFLRPATYGVSQLVRAKVNG